MTQTTPDITPQFTPESIDPHLLKVSKANVRAKKKADDLDTLKASILAHGLINPILVDPDNAVIAGRRRLTAILQLLKEKQLPEDYQVPIQRANANGEASAMSLAENTARRDMDPLDEAESFHQLLKQGKSHDQVAAEFGVPVRYVKQRRALATVVPEAKKQYRAGDRELSELQALTTCHPNIQRKLLKNKHWVVSRQSVSQAIGDDVDLEHALFSVDEAGIAYTEDLFDSDGARVCAEPDKFWRLQEAAIEKAAQALRDTGWAKVTVMGRGEWFNEYQHRKVKKADGGEVFIQVHHDGEVKIHKGYKGGAGSSSTKSAKEKPQRRELTSDGERYFQQWHHAMVRHHLQLPDNHERSLKLLVAHMLVGVGVRLETDGCSDLKASFVSQALSDSDLHAGLVSKSHQVVDLFDGIETVFNHRWEGTPGLIRALEILLPMPMNEVLEVVSILTAAALNSQSALVEYLGVLFGIDPGDHWCANVETAEQFKGKPVLEHVLQDLGIRDTLPKSATAKAMRSKVAEHLAEGGDWIPPYMQFPMMGYASETAPEMSNKYSALSLSVGEAENE